MTSTETRPEVPTAGEPTDVRVERPGPITAMLDRLPMGHRLDDTSFAARHKLTIRVSLGLLLCLPVVAVLIGEDLDHTLLEMIPMGLAIGVGIRASRRSVATMAIAIALMMSSSLLVHFTNGLIESHFLFFVLLPLVAIYQDLRAFLGSIGFVLFHHAVVGTIAPESVYNHPAAINNPIGYGFIHAGFVVALVVVLIVEWNISEGAQHLARERLTDLQVSQAELVQRDLVEARRLGDLNRRFRSLVESAQDVITVVADTDSLTVMSPGLGVLEMVTQTSSPSTVAELLAPDQYAVWASADQRLQGQLSAETFEVESKRPDGTTLFLEVQGSRLTDGTGERVWVWRDITARKVLELQLVHQAFHDPLTGLANRALLMDRAHHALTKSARTGSPVVLLFCDLDEFKAVNDSLGHGRGDELLTIITERLQSCIRDSDTLARFGGDEFAILLEDSDSKGAVVLAERILSLVTEEVVLDDQPIFPSISVGIASSIPGTTTDELLRNADIAMYGAKRAGKGRFEVFQAGMHDIASDLLEMQVDLKSAIQNDELDLHYQPIIALGTGMVESVEALIRWRHPTRGDVPPATFIPVAEATGQIVGIGRWVLSRACHTAVELQAGRSGPLHMHVNLSPQHLRDPQVTALTRAALEDSGLAPELLVLEVTEGFLLDDSSAIERLGELHSLGVQIAVDDFGTGYTSINYLQQLPVDIIKIDRSFISGDALAPSDRRAFLHALLGLARSLNLRTVGEGIEQPHQLDELRELGCESGQGYLWAPGVPASELLARIDQLDAANSESVTAE